MLHSERLQARSTQTRLPSDTFTTKRAQRRNAQQGLTTKQCFVGIVSIGSLANVPSACYLCCPLFLAPSSLPTPANLVHGSDSYLCAAHIMNRIKSPGLAAPEMVTVVIVSPRIMSTSGSRISLCSLHIQQVCWRSSQARLLATRLRPVSV